MSLKLLACIVATISHWANGEKAVVRRITSTVKANGELHQQKVVVRSAKDNHNEGERGAIDNPQGLLSEQTRSLADVNVALHSLEDRVEKIEDDISHTQGNDPCSYHSPSVCPTHTDCALIAPWDCRTKTPECEVKVYEHWPEGINTGMLNSNMGTELRDCILSWNGYFPLGVTESFVGNTKHNINATIGMVSTVKVTAPNSASCCQARGYKDVNCNTPMDIDEPIKSNVIYEEVLGAGIVAARRSLTKKWGCNDCTMCVLLEPCT